MNISGNFTSQSNYNKLKKLNKKLEKNFKKLSSGNKINQAADDAAGMAISEKIQSQIQGSEKALQNINDGLSMLQTADGGLQEMLNYAQRMRELAVQAANGTLTEQDRRQLNKEFQELKEGVGDISENTEFGNSEIKLLRPPLDKEKSNENGKADIIFVIDNTGSMGSIINNTINNLNELVSKLDSNNVDARFSVVEYGEGTDSIKKNNFFDSPSDLKTYLENINPTGGDDKNESGLEGLVSTNGAINYDFRKNASKNIIMLTDAPVHDNDDGDNGDGLSEHDIDQVATKFANNNIKLNVVGPESTTNNQYERLTGPSGGSYLDITGDFANKLSLLGDNISNDSGASAEMKPLKLQVGPNSGDILEIKLPDLRLNQTKIKDSAVDPRDKAIEAINKLDKFISKLSNIRSGFGADQSQLKHSRNNISNYKENINAANSRIKDLDMAKEITNITRTQILQQASQAMLAHSKSIDSNILDLFS